MTKEEKDLLVSVSYVGNIVIQRIEEAGYKNLKDLAKANPEAVLLTISKNLGSACWRNSHQAQKAIYNAVAAAKESTGTK